METLTSDKRTNRSGQFSKRTSGNPAGRPPGSRNRAALLMESMLEDAAEELTSKVIEMASNGDISALRLCFERLFPPARTVPSI